MRHVDPELLALLALGELVAEPDDRDHIAECAQCSDEITELAHTAAVGRTTLGAGELMTPDERVWDRIADQLALAPERQLAPVVTLRPRGSRRWLPALVGAAAAIALVFSGVVTWQALQPASYTVLATATLDAFPEWPGATGTATVEERSDGARVVQVSFEAPGLQDGYREVWLITSDATRLVSLGVVRGTSGTFTIPDGVDITKYDLVDISDEPYDGDPTHSGVSIVRGQLGAAA